MEAKHHMIQGKLVPGTGRFIVNSPEFLKWISTRNDQSERPILWCTGPPGNGKTSQASVVIEHLQQSYSHPTAAVAFFYCTWCRTPKLASTAYEVLSTICKQLASQSAELPSSLTQLHYQPGDATSGEPIGLHHLVLALLAFCDSFEEVFICVDAISEMETDERSILMPKLQLACDHRAKLFVTSTIHGDIVELCSCNNDINGMYKGEVHLYIPAQDKDVRKFVSQQLEGNQDAQRLLRTCGMTSSALMDKVVEECGGMFEIAQMLLDRELHRILDRTQDLKKHYTESDSQRLAPAFAVSDSIPPQEKSPVDEAAVPTDPVTNIRSNVWRSALLAIRNQSPLRQDLALRTLCWVGYGFERLSVHELLDALASELGPRYSYRITSSDGQSRVLVLIGLEPPPRDEQAWENAVPLIDICENLISITVELEVIISDPMVVEEQLWKGLLPNPHSTLATSCLKFLGRNDVIVSCQMDKWQTPEEFTEAERAMPFKRYAQKYWHSHVVASEDPGLDDKVIDYLNTITQDSASWTERQQTLGPGKAHGILAEDNETAIFKAARLGLNRILKKLLLTELNALSDRRDMKDRVNVVSFEGHTALSVAVEHGHISTAQLLYRYGGWVHHRNRVGHGLLHIAADRDDGVMIMLLLYFGLEVDYRQHRHLKTPLHVAAQKNSVKAAKVLLDNEADTNATDVQGRDTMCIAARAGQLEFVKMLVGRCIDLSSPSRPRILSSSHSRSPRGAYHEQSYLSYAVRSRSLSLVLYMIENGASVFELDDRKRSIVHDAVDEGHLDIVKLLVEKGIDPFAEDDNGITALGQAISEGHQRIVEYLLSRLDANASKRFTLDMAGLAITAQMPEAAKDLIARLPGYLEQDWSISSNTILGRAVGSDDEEMLRFVLDRGALVEGADEAGWRPLHVAAHLGRSKAVDSLLLSGADPTARTINGMTPLHIAAYEGHIDVLEVLLQRDPDFSVRAEDGSTPLIAAGYGSKPGAVRLFLEHGVSANESNMDGETVLHLAVGHGDVGLVQDVLKYDVDLSITSRNGGSALHTAACKGEVNIIRLLLAHAADIELCHTFMGNGYESLENSKKIDLLPWYRSRRKRDLSFSAQAQYTPLHSAVCGGSVKAVQELLESGARINAKAAQGESPLHVAAAAALHGIIEVLLQFGADVSAITYYGETPLHWAYAGSFVVEIDYGHNKSEPFYEWRRISDDPPLASSRTECISLLARKSADSKVRSLDYQSMPTSSVQAHHVDLAEVNDETFQYRPLEHSRSFRLLRHLTGETSSDLISFDLVHVLLEDFPRNPGFRAVSYTWGDPTPACPVRINGKMCSLPKSSFEFLQRVYNGINTKSFWWIDAICIDQANLDEKAVQIPLMKDIYSKAFATFIWVGPPTEHSTLALPFMQKFGELWRKAREVKRSDLEWYLSETSTTMDSPEWQAVADFFCSPWFRRVWTMQEFILTKKPLVWDGQNGCSWNGLAFGRLILAKGIYRHLRLRSRLKGVVAPGFEDLMNLALDYQKRRNDTFKSFTRVWWKSLSSQATNLADYVYGVLGLIDLETDGSPGILPDFRKDDVEVFADAVSLCFRRDNNYNVLSLAGVGIFNTSKALRRLPSWVPRFHLEKVPQLLAMSENRTNCAGGSSPSVLTRKFSFEHRYLTVKGAIVDTIAELLTDTFMDRTYLDDSENDMGAWVRKAIASAHNSSLLDLSSSRSLEKWARTLMLDSLAIRSDSEDEYSPQVYVKKYESFLKVIVNNLKISGAPGVDSVTAILSDTSFPESERRDADTYGGTMGRGMLLKRLAITDTGDLAVVQSLSKVGDRICILPGGKVPYTIRKVSKDNETEERYEFVGESYVDNLMRGNGLVTASLRDITLI